MAPDEQLDLDALDDQLDRELGDRRNGLAGLILPVGIAVALGVVVFDMPTIWAGYVLLAGAVVSAVVHTATRHKRPTAPDRRDESLNSGRGPST